MFSELVGLEMNMEKMFHSHVVTTTIKVGDSLKVVDKYVYLRRQTWCIQLPEIARSIVE